MRLIDADKYMEKLYAMMPEFDEENDKKCIEGQTIFFCIATLDDMPTITPPPNTPLTLEELREMDGEPVWIIPMRGSGGFRTWMLVDAEYELCREAHGEMAVFENCGKTWLAYRRRPEEGTV